MASSPEKGATVPFLRWAGSKRQLIPQLSQYWSGEFRRYIEPFMGSACLFFSLQPRNAVLSDINADLVQTFLEVRDNGEEVWRLLKKWPRSREVFYKMRKADPRRLSAAKAAARFIYLNRFCFNGLYRTNLRGQFNVPYAPARTGMLPSKEALKACAILLRRAKIIASDFEDILSETRKGDFVYMDPPFATRERRVFTEYSAEIFGEVDLLRLSDALHDLDRRKVRFVVSYADCRLARETLGTWHCSRVRSRRNIAGFGKHRGYAYEIIATNIS